MNITERKHNELLIMRALETLPLRERGVLKRKYFDDATRSEIAREFGVSLTRISEIERRGLRKLRELSCRGSRRGDDYLTILGNAINRIEKDIIAKFSYYKVDSPKERAMRLLRRKIQIERHERWWRIKQLMKEREEDRLIRKRAILTRIRRRERFRQIYTE